MNNVNPSALLRSLIVYAICVPLAIIVGYTLVNLTNANFQDLSSLGVIGVLLVILIFPLLMKWHYPLLIFCWSFPACIFFLPGRPTIFFVMVAISLTISIVERVLDRKNAFLPASGVQWPLFAFIALIIITAKLTGGFGLRATGSDVYGGKKYVFLLVGIMSFFALIARPIPRKKANLYITLYFAGAFFTFISDLYAYTPDALQSIYLIFPPAAYNPDAAGAPQIELGTTRLIGIAASAGTVVVWLFARNGFRNTILTGKLWRPALVCAMLMLVMLGGFRSFIINMLLLLTFLFFLEGLHRTGMLLVVLAAGIFGSALLVPLAPHLPFTFQRSLAFLPLDISSEARMDAEGSTQWRLDMWEALSPQIPKYLLLGRGYGFSSEVFKDYMGVNATFKKIMDAADDPLALASDFHSGPLSLIIPFGIWAVLIWIWYMAAGFYVVWRNYRHGDPELRNINRFLFANFVVSGFAFIFIFGDVTTDIGHFAGIIGLSIALNHGVKRRPAPVQNQPAVPQVQTGRYPALPARPIYPALN